MNTFLYVALGCVLISLGQTADVTQTIDVAVLEFAPATKAETDKSLIQTNLDNCLKLVKGNPKLIVLPEYGLTGRTDDKSKAISSTDFKNKDLEYLNNQAKKIKATIVASLLEKDGDDLYSTTLVFNGTDKLIAKYRKINLNATVEKDLTSANEITTFKLEGYNDLTVGLLSGDDILYDEPANKVLKDGKANLIIYTSSMASVAPFRTTVSLHAGFAKAHGVNLLVASLNDPKKGVSGSGIYTPCDSIPFIVANEGSKKVLSGSIDVKPTTDCNKSLKDVLLFGSRMSPTDTPLADLPLYNYQGMNTSSVTANIINQTLCDGSFCCQFNVTSAEWKKNEIYMLAVSGDVKVCGLMSCKNGTLESCGRVDNAVSTNFAEISIKTSDDDKTFVPYVLHKDMLPGSDLKKVTFQNGDDGSNFKVAELTDVIAVAIVAAKSGASSLQIFTTGIMAMIFILKQL